MLHVWEGANYMCPKAACEHQWSSGRYVDIDVTRARFPADAALSTLVPEDAQCQELSGTEMMT